MRSEILKLQVLIYQKNTQHTFHCELQSVPHGGGVLWLRYDGLGGCILVKKHVDILDEIFHHDGLDADLQ